MAIHVLGIRHHGPGSARNVRSFLESVKPDIILVEGPPEADAVLQWATHKELKPPVAILCYQPDNPQQSCFYPFANFSPEWQAILYAKNNNLHVRFIDLPAANQFAIEAENKKEENKAAPAHPIDEDKTGEAAALNNMALLNNVIPLKGASPLKSNQGSAGWLQNNISSAETVLEENETPALIRLDPIAHLAHAAGYDDGEKWWEHIFEHRVSNEEVFDAVAEAMGALREAIPEKDNRLEQLREAHMRKMIRQAEKEMFQNIAVICGAWHVPALLNMPKQKDDNDLLKGLPKTKVECTWIPWTFNRLSFYSGYGAGIVSPGWYDHIWNHPSDDGTLWMAKVAKLFREKEMDTSVAHVIEAVRLANALASLRNLSKAGLEELNEATLSILCNGEPVMMGLVHNELIVSNRIGEVPAEIPKPPLQLDIEKNQKRLRLPALADWKDYTLDLRKENDLERSIFLHRLLLLEIKWGNKSEVGGKGTFKEQWRLQWDPALSIDIIDKGSWGNTTEEAAAKYVINLAGKAGTLPAVCSILENTIPAELPASVEVLIQQINNLAAASGDTMQLMEVIPGLVNVSRYGNVRKTDAELVNGIVTSMITRICISLPAACTAVDEDASMHLLELFQKMNDAVNVLQQPGTTRQWQQTLSIIAAGKNSSPIIAGYSTRLLADYKIMEGDELIRSFYYAMSSASAPAVAAAWLEGFLKGSGTILLVDNDLWNVVNNWVEQLEEAVFTQVLPLLRRTFSGFSKPERRKLGEKVKHGAGGTNAAREATGIDEERAKKGIDVIMKMMGYTIN